MGRLYPLHLNSPNWPAPLLSNQYLKEQWANNQNVNKILKNLHGDIHTYFCIKKIDCFFMSKKKWQKLNYLFIIYYIACMKPRTYIKKNWNDTRAWNGTYKTNNVRSKMRFIFTIEKIENHINKRKKAVNRF